MAETESGTIWSTAQEFVRALQREDPTVRHWIALLAHAKVIAP